MASISSGGMFRQSKNLKGRKGAEPTLSKALPPPVSSEQYRKVEVEISSYTDIPSGANGAHSTKEEDHFGFLYSVSEKDFH